MLKHKLNPQLSYEDTTKENVVESMRRKEYIMWVFDRLLLYMLKSKEGNSHFENYNTLNM